MTESKKASIIIGEKISQLRKTAKLTQEDLAYKTGISLSTIKRYEEGDSQSINKLEIIAEALKVSLGDLLSNDIKKRNSFPIAKESKGEKIVYSLKVLYAYRIITIHSKNNTNSYLINQSTYPVGAFLDACKNYEEMYYNVDNKKIAYPVLNRIEKRFAKIFDKQ